jgi:hypothetical protein
MRPTWRSRPGNGSRFGNGPRRKVALSGAGASAPLTQASVGGGRWKVQMRASVHIERTAGGNTGGAAGTKVERPKGLAAGRTGLRTPQGGFGFLGVSRVLEQIGRLGDLTDHGSRIAVHRLTVRFACGRESIVRNLSSLLLRNLQSGIRNPPHAFCPRSTTLCGWLGLMTHSPKAKRSLPRFVRIGNCC